MPFHTVCLGTGDDAADGAAEVGDDVVMTIDHEPLPPHLAQFERRRYENDFEVRIYLSSIETMELTIRTL
jgi:hypothetical protein